MSSESSTSTAAGPMDDRSEDLLVSETIALVGRWLDLAAKSETRQERGTQRQLHRLLDDADGTAFAMRFVDRVIRPEDPAVAAHQFASLVKGRQLPSFLSPIDRVLIVAGARLAPRLPRLVMPLAIRRMRQLVGHLVVDARPDPMLRHLATSRGEGYSLNVNLLGEAVLGQEEADRRLASTRRLLTLPDVDYVSVKASSVVAQMPHWDHDAAVERVVARLRPLYRDAAASSPPAFVNLDMEEYRDLHTTIDAFTELLDETEFHTLSAGIVLQAYLPDSFDALCSLAGWAQRRKERIVGGRPGADIKIRLVKGANLAMEKMEAEVHGWPQAPYASKAEVDANFKRCVDWVLHPQRLGAVRVGIASHNLFDVAWALLVARRRGVTERVDFEMLQGMAEAVARTVRDDSGGLLLYTPVVSPRDFDVAISYLFRRLEENAADENFIRHLFNLKAGTTAFDDEVEGFATAVQHRWSVATRPRRTQDRTEPAEPADEDQPFENEPDTDPVLPANRRWAAKLVGREPEPPRTPMTTTIEDVDRAVASARSAVAAWAGRPVDERRSVLRRVGDELARRRGDLVASMVHEGAKTVAQADPEVSEAIDFARWYADRAGDTEASASARFEALGVVAVVPPWNFPVAIPAGGVLAALAAGNTVVLKPAPETPRCAEIVAECCWSAGVPDDAVHFVRTPDDAVGRHLITHPDIGAVVLTGAWDTAQLFRSWRPDLRLFAETSGKNALVITPNADLDLAVADLVYSAFGHAGQKCSAASLAICVGDVGESDRFRRQLVDATRTLAVGQATDLTTAMNPTIGAPEGKLRRGLTQLEPGEEWLLRPERRDDGLWTPGIRIGVSPGSWFHTTECFGPVLGVMEAPSLDAAIDLQNSTGYGLTGGIHSLDDEEVDHWIDRVEVGNAYVNRATTGAIVRRQPFGGWKRSTVGPGAKAGGPNYVTQLGRWLPTDNDLDDERWLAAATTGDAAAWASEFSVEHDPTGLAFESNVFRYRPISVVLIRIGEGTATRELERVRLAARTVGVRSIESRALDESVDVAQQRLLNESVDRVRALGGTEPDLRSAAFEAGVHYSDDPVTTDGRIELLHYLREQAISRTTHRYGNIIN